MANNGVLMTPEEIKAFYKDLGELCTKYRIQGVCGLWFGSGEEMGRMTFYTPTDPQLKAIVYAVSEKFEQFAKSAGVTRGPNLGEIRGVVGPNGMEN